MSIPQPGSRQPVQRAREADAGRNPDQDSPRFILAVMPDTQFLYWGTRGSINPGAAGGVSFCDGREPQRVFYPVNQTSSTTLCGQGLPGETWWHVAVVNDGAHTTMYVEGCPTVTSPTRCRPTGSRWVVDVRIVNRPLLVRDFMINH